MIFISVKLYIMKKTVLVCLLFISTFSVTHAQAQDTSLQQFEGKYIFFSGSVVPDVTVKFDKGILTSSSAEGSSVLVKLGIDSFAITSFQGTAVFKRNISNKITGVIVDAMGYHLEGTRVKEPVIEKMSGLNP
jgi:hypothetical protein